ncbi:MULTISPECIES: hypothetical protein [unclassified Streptomyces]|uniref:hypothetical protein n=1 Tax=unclassified Streptomyces TaxID=2593676 RepID=UPI0034503B9C
MKVRQAVRSTVTAIVSIVALGSLSHVAWAAQTPGLPLASCAQAVRQTKADLQNAGAPTSSNDWQSVRDAAQQFINDHPGGGSGVEALQRDVQLLNSQCAP